MENLVGKQFGGRYEIMQLIGVGGMSNVYRAKDLEENKVVAIKALRKEHVGNPEFVNRFRNESKAVSMLSHPNIVQVYDVAMGDQPCIVMEHIEGITLKEYIEQEGRIGWKMAVHFVVQILRGLGHAHDKGIIHQDIKPHNIMLLRDGTVKITDFGIAQLSRTPVRQTSDQAVGSVHYISPEQARGEQTDASTDIYSVGVMLYEMLTGKLPFEADSPVSVAIKQIESEAVPPTAINPDIPPTLEAITLVAMEKQAGQRYRSAAEMLRSIDRFRKNPEGESEEGQQSIPAPAPTPTAPPPTPPKKRGREKKKEKEDMKKGTPILPVLTGITIAFVVATIIFVTVMVMIADPFAEVENIALPDLVGMSYEVVSSTPQYADNFNIVIEETRPSADYAAGTIMSQSPSSVPTLKKGSTITVIVSGGAQIVTIPSYAGQEATTVYVGLNELGLEYSEVSVESDTVQEGYVVRTEPGPNSQVSTGTSVTVYVSRGSDKMLVEVPDVTDEYEDDAVEILEDAGFEVDVSRQQSEYYDEGEVISQTPDGGTMFTEGSSIQLTVSSGDEAVDSLDILVRLPELITHEVTLTAERDGDFLREVDLVPSEQRVWQITLQGDGISDVTIYLDGVEYMAYMVNFDDESVVRTKDYSDDFANW